MGWAWHINVFLVGLHVPAVSWLPWTMFLKVLCHCSRTLSTTPAGSLGSVCRFRVPRRLFLRACSDPSWHLNRPKNSIKFKYNDDWMHIVAEKFNFRNRGELFWCYIKTKMWLICSHSISLCVTFICETLIWYLEWPLEALQMLGWEVKINLVWLTLLTLNQNWQNVNKRHKSVIKLLTYWNWPVMWKSWDCSHFLWRMQYKCYHLWRAKKHHHHNKCKGHGGWAVWSVGRRTGAEWSWRWTEVAVGSARLAGGGDRSGEAKMLH